MLVIEPNFLFFDKPLVGLDTETGRLVEDVILECQKTEGITTLLATSSDTLAARLGGDRFHLDQGKVARWSPSAARPSPAGPPAPDPGG